MEIVILQGELVTDSLFISVQKLFDSMFSNSQHIRFTFQPIDHYDLNQTEEEFYEDDLKKIDLSVEEDEVAPGNDFDYFFSQIKSYRKTFNIDPSARVIMLTGKKNKRNFTGWSDDNNVNAFINVSVWRHIYESSVDVIYPVSFEVVSWALRLIMFDTNTTLYENVHFTITPCINDFCSDVKTHPIKSKSGDICTSCLSKINEKLNKVGFKDFENAIEKLRGFILARNNDNVVPTLELIEVNDKVVFSVAEWGGIHLNLQPRHVSFYWLFLKHPDGLKLLSLRNHRDELLRLHSRVNRYYSKDKVVESVDKIIPNRGEHPEEASSIKSKINKTISDVFPKNIENNFRIQGDKGGPNFVKLDRTKFRELLREIGSPL
jgi:hypothetical protein